MTLWEVLGIAPTDDRRAIRQAYAARLKALDVDQDPDAFERLRRARDWALAAADAAGFDEGEMPEPPAMPAAENTAADAAEEPVPEWLQEVLRHHAALVAILSAGDGKTPVDDAGDAAMLAHFEGMIADPRLDDVGFHADAEAWFAGAIAHACPRADPLVLPAARHFGWLNDGDEISRSEEIVWLTRRARAMLFLDDVRQPGHAYHREWRELTTPAYEGSRRGRWIRRGRIRQLLALVRTNYPSLEGHFDWYRVSLWEKSNNVGRFSGLGFVVWMVILLLRPLAASYESGQHPHAPSTTTADEPDASVFLGAGGKLADVGADIDAALQPMFGRQLTAEMLDQQNPRLLAILKNYWKTDRAADVGRGVFGGEIRQLLLDRFPGDLRRADYPLVAGYRNFQLDQLQAAAAQGYDSCYATLTGKPWSPPSDDMRIRRNGYIAQVLLHADDGAPPRKGKTSYWVPEPVVTKATAASGLSAAQFKAAMAGKGSPEQRCRKEIAMLKTVLALPQKDGLPLLRQM